MPRKHRLLDEPFEQSWISENTSNFLKQKGSAYTFESSGGKCYGYSMLWGLSVIQTIFVTNRSAGDTALNWFFDTSHMLMSPVPATYKNPDNILRYAHNVDYFQSSQVHQNNLPKPVNNFLTYSREYTLGGEFTQEHLQQILPQIAFEGRVVMINSEDHATALMRVGDKYFFFNSNQSGQQVFADTAEELAELTTTIFRAFQRNDAEALSLSFEAMHFNSPNLDPEFQQKQNYPAQAELLTHYSTRNSLSTAAQIGCIESVRTILDAPSDINKVRQTASTALYLACQNGHLDVVIELLNRLEIDVNTRYNGITPITMACQMGHLDIVIELLKQPGIDVNTEDNGVTPLAVACQHGHLDVVKELLKKQSEIDINAVSNTGSTALYSACLFGHLAVVKELLKQSSVDVNKGNNEGMTPLDLAYYGRSHEIVSELVKNPKIEIEPQKLLQLLSGAFRKPGMVDALLCYAILKFMRYLMPQISMKLKRHLFNI
jgi:ankyrin repeat protein